MVAEQVKREPEFTGTKKFRTIGSRTFEVLRAHGMFMSGNAPIRIPVEELTGFLVEHDGVKKADVLTAIRENPDVFVLETRNDVEYVVTTREGHPPNAGSTGITHSFAERFLTPEPKPIRPAPVPVTRVRVDPNWATYSVPDFSDEDENEGLDDLGAVDAISDETVQVIVEPAEKAETPAAPVSEALPIEPAAATEETVGAAQPDVEEETDPVIAVESEPLAGAEEAPVQRASPEVTPQVQRSAPEETPQEQRAAPEAAPVQRTAPEAAPVQRAAPEAVPVQRAAPEVAPVRRAAPEFAAASLTDVSAYTDDEIIAALERQLITDSRIAHFAGQWMLEERVPRLSRGDLRRMKEYIQEQEQPLTDSMLVQDILNVRPNSVEFDLMQFAVNFRLLREHRDFDFVGTNDQRFWSTGGLPQIGTTRRKPNEIGTDYRFLLDEKVPVESIGTEKSVDHVLSFYEYSLGLLPYDADLQKLLPEQVSDDQRSAVLTFEIPQSYTTYLVELRYPTPNRGGFLLGLDDLYSENLVPGAMISIAATENDGHFKVEFLAAADQNARLLELDDRRSPRFLFRPTTFHCEVVPEWLISEDRFPRVGSEKPLDDKVRRRPEAVVDATFARIGSEEGDSFVASFDDLLAAVNIERPFSATLLRNALEQDSKVTNDGSDMYTYVAPS